MSRAGSRFEIGWLNFLSQLARVERLKVKR